MTRGLQDLEKIIRQVIREELAARYHLGTPPATKAHLAELPSTSMLARGERSASSPEVYSRSVCLPSLLDTNEFAFLIRETPESVRRKIRQRKIKAKGCPARIPCRELERFGVDLADAARLLHERSARLIAA
jgi:hypothetical protein